MSLKPASIYFALLIASGLVNEPIRVEGTRIRLHPNEEPESDQIYNNYRMLRADPNLYYLKSAGLLEDQDIGAEMLEDERGPDGKFLKGNFMFNSSEFLRKEATIKWFIPYEERQALQVYDDPHDMDLAMGSQVDREFCGLHLDYMLHQIKKHHTNLINTTESSIFNIMNSFSSPTLGLSLGNHVFPGDYQSCIGTKLNVIKHELDRVNRSLSDRYFAVANGNDYNYEKSSFIPDIIRHNVGPFVGFPRERKRVSLHKVRDRLQALPMRYCFISIRWPEWSNSSFYRRNFALRTAACLPKTCDSTSLNYHADKIKQLADTQMTDYQSGYYIEQLYCLPDEKSELRNPFNYTNTTAFIVFNLIWLSLVVISTMIYAYMSKDISRKLNFETHQYELSTWEENSWWLFLSSWCLQKNLRNFLVAKRGQTTKLSKSSGGNKRGSISALEKLKTFRLNFEPLEGFKVVSSLSVIASHACTVTFGAAWNVKQGHTLISNSWLAMMNVVCPAVVDNFFVVTGIITARILFQTSHTTLCKPIFWLKFIVYRYVRIIPLYLFVHWFLQSTFRFIGSGPFWDYGTSHSAWSKVCRDESMWTILLPSANFKSPAAHCNGVGWYIANDFQFSLVTPIFIILLLKKPLVGYMTIIGSSLAIMVNHVNYYYHADQDPRGVFEWSQMSLTRVLDDTTAGYVYPQYRVLAYLIGLAAGHVLHRYEIGEIKQWPRSFQLYGKVFFFASTYLLCFTPYITSIINLDDQETVRLLASIFSGLLHGLTAITAAVFILLLCTGYLPYFSYLYSMSFLKPLANISLSILLIHIPIQFYHVQTLRSLPELSSYHFITTTFIWAIEAYLVAMAVHVLYELPLRKFLIKLVLNLLAYSQSEDNSENQSELKVKSS